MLGEIRCFAFESAPAGWMKCDGQVLQVADYPALHGLIGTTYGGDGVNTFAIPDLRDRAPVHHGATPIGGKVGASEIVLTVAHLPEHSHTLLPKCNNDSASSDNPEGNYIAPAQEDTYGGSSTSTMGAMTTEATGGGMPIDARGPRLSLNFCIAVQ